MSLETLLRDAIPPRSEEGEGPPLEVWLESMHMYSAIHEHTRNRISPHIRGMRKLRGPRETCRFLRFRTRGNTVALVPRRWNTVRQGESRFVDPRERSIRRDCTEGWEFED